MQTSGRAAFERATVALLGLILVTALALRLVGINFGLPLQLHPDEWSQVGTAQGMLGGDLNPHFFRYPSLAINQLFVIDGGLAFVGEALKQPPTTETLFLVGRLVTAMYGALAVAAVFWLGKLVGGSVTGLIAALAMAVSAEPIVQSHYATVDMVLTFWITLALALGLWAFARERSFVPAGVAVGLAIGSKYTAVLLLPSLILLILWQSAARHEPVSARRLTLGRALSILFGAMLLLVAVSLPVNSILDVARRWTTDGNIEGEYVAILNTIRWLVAGMGLGLLVLGLGSVRVDAAKKVLGLGLTPQLWLMLASAAFVFAISSPFFFLDLPTALRDFFYEYRHVAIGAAAHFPTTDPLYNSLLPSGLLPDPTYYWRWWIELNGWILTAAVLIGIYFLSRVNKPAAAATLLFVLITLFVLTKGANKANRYALVVLPILFVWAAVGVVRICAYLPRNIQSFAIVAVTLAMLIVPMNASAQSVQKAFLAPDTRTVAYQWILANLPADSTVLREDRTPDLEHTNAPLSIVARTSAFETQTLDDWKREGIEYALIGPMSDWYAENAAVYPRIADEYQKLRAQGQLLAVFQADGTNVVGPTIRVYKIQ